MLKLLSLLFFIWAGFLIWQRNAPLPPAPTPVSISQPMTLSLPDLNISLPVLVEPLTPKGVTFEPHGNNLVFYGHNWLNILGSLKKAQVGQRIVIGYADGTAKQFEIKTLSVVSGSDIEILQPTTYEVLTLYTCTGFLDRERLIATAFPI